MNFTGGEKRAHKRKEVNSRNEVTPPVTCGARQKDSAAGEGGAIRVCSSAAPQGAGGHAGDEPARVCQLPKECVACQPSSSSPVPTAAVVCVCVCVCACACACKICVQSVVVLCSAHCRAEVFVSICMYCCVCICMYCRKNCLDMCSNTHTMCVCVSVCVLHMYIRYILIFIYTYRRMAVGRRARELRKCSYAGLATG